MPQPANYLNAFRGPDLASIDRAAYSNALLDNDVRRLPQRNAAEDVAMQGDQLALGESQKKGASDFLVRSFSLMAQDPNRAQEIISSPAFQSASKALQLPAFSMDGETPQSIAQKSTGWAQAVAGRASSGEGFTLSPGQTRYGAGGQRIASASAAPSDNDGYTLSPGQQRYGANNQMVASVPNAPPTQPAGQGFDQAAKLRAEFNAQTANFRTATEGFRAVQAAAKNPSAAGDIALIFSFMRTLDPNSTVREGEFATAQNAGGVPDKVRAQYNSIINGQRLSADQRQDFVSQAGNLYNSHRQGYDSLAAKYSDFATRAGVNPADVVGTFAGVDTGGGGGGGGAGRPVTADSDPLGLFGSF